MIFSPYSILIFSPMGKPSGLLKITKDDWSGEGVPFPRTRVGEARLRDGFKKRPGIYLLISARTNEAYSSEADPVGERLDRHYRERDFRDRALFFTSVGMRFNKAHIQHLEARLVGLAREAQNCKLLNANIPQTPTLSEKEHAFAENFLRHMLCIFPILGCYHFTQDSAQEEGAVLDGIVTTHKRWKRTRRFDLAPISGRIFTLKTKDLKAKAKIIDGDFVALVGSRAVAATSEMFEVYAPHLVQLRLQLLKSEVLVKRDDQFKFLSDQSFSSPSTAAVIKGMSSNADGWIDEKGQNLRDVLCQIRGV